MQFIRYSHVIASFAACLISTICLAQSSPPAPSTPTELPDTARPTHYDIAIEPDAQALTFRGTATIALDVVRATDSLTLHALDLSIQSAKLSSASHPAYDSPQISLDSKAQTATFKFRERLAPGAYQLALQYTGKIGTSTAGLFAIDYDTPTGKKRALYTQFEIADARRMIPCWDEPQFKATFALQATVPSDQMAVSNMPVEKRTEVGDGRTLVRFERSPRMSTYLLVFALGEFERITERVGTTELGMVTRAGAVEQAKFALDSSARVLREFNDYFGVPYPLKKLDNIAVPASSQAWAAMENWGAIVSFEFALLMDPTISTQADKQYIFRTAGHEIAHQWFGNLVTMRWWDDLWLNEGFASWLEARTTARLHPEWNAAMSGVNSSEAAMSRDALVTTHPVVQAMRTADEANQFFDAISYEKGEAVLRMLEDYVGAEAWREGVRRYIKAHAYGNAVSDDLWKAMEASSNQPVTAIAHDFTLQPGVPLIAAKADACQQGRTKVQLTQKEFSRDQPDKKPLTWRVPVIVRALGEQSAQKVVVNGEASIDVPSCAPVIVNAGHSGYYRTLYSPSQFAAIAAKFSVLEPIDQLGVISDSWALGLTGQQPLADFFLLAKATPPDADPFLWRKIANVFDAVDDYYRGDAARQARFRSFAIARLAPTFARVGWAVRKDEPEPVSLLRANLIETLSALGDPALINEARRRYAAQKSDPTALPPALRKSILSVVARHADEKTWNELHATARDEKVPLVKEKLYSLLGEAEDAALARRALELSLNPDLGGSISATIISTVANLHPDLAFEFATAHAAQIHDMLDPYARSHFVPYLARTSLAAATIEKVKAYAEKYLPPDAHKSADTIVATIEDRIRVKRERLPSIDAWLAANAGER